MQYKGDDMDLRVPHARTPRESYAGSDLEPPFVNGRWRVASGSTSAGTEPLWVDETVLACCNTAFDMALAHGAAEVELEHLVHALTRVEAAARILEARGVREGQLRRDSAALMASDVPTNLAGDRLAPRRSVDVEDALRRAVEIAARRGSAATVDDLLWVLLHYGRDVPAVQLLRRMTPDWQRPDWGRSRDMTAIATETPRYAPPPPEPPRYMPAPETMRLLPPGAVDHFSQRLAVFEDGLRALHAELSSDRKSLTELIRDMQRDIVAHRGDAAALRSDLGQRLEMLERGLQARAEASRVPAQLGERIQQLEKAVQAGMSEGARNWAALGQRLQGFESQLMTPAGGQSVADRIAALEAGLDARVTDIGRGVATLTDRMVSIERMTETSAGEGARRWTSLSDRLGNLETLLATRTREPLKELETLTERLSGLETAVRSGFGEAARQGQSVMDRVGDVEKHVASLPTDQSESALFLDERLASVENRLDTGLATQGELIKRVLLQLTAIEARPANEATLTPAALAQISTPLAERIAGVERGGLQQALEAKAALGDLATRVIALEQSIVQSLASQDETARARDREIAEMHDALIRLGENQHTLASAISDWRQENHNRLATVTGQLEKLLPPEISQAQPVKNERLPTFVNRDAGAPGADGAVLPTSSPLPANTSPQTAEDLLPGDERKSTSLPVAKGRGFWWWLFGTDNVRRSNRESELRWELMHQRLQQARSRIRDKT